jgi:hypothetical protein
MGERDGGAYEDAIWVVMGELRLTHVVVLGTTGKVGHRD